MGEVELNFLVPNKPALVAKIGLVTEDGLVGAFEKRVWSDKVLEALQTFAGILEEDALQIVFEAEAQQEPTGTPEPPQF